MSDQNRLFQLYQIYMSLQDGEYSGDVDGERYGEEYDEFYMPIGESGERAEIDKAKVIRLARAIIDIARHDEDFEDDLPSIEEVLEALEKGPALYRAFAERFKATVDAVVDDWNQKFPECKTLGEVEEAKRLAGSRIQ